MNCGKATADAELITSLTDCVLKRVTYVLLRARTPTKTVLSGREKASVIATHPLCYVTAQNLVAYAAATVKITMRC